MTTTIQDAYAPGIRRRQEIIKRDYVGGTQPEPDKAADEPPKWLRGAAAVGRTIGTTTIV